MVDIKALSGTVTTVCTSGLVTQEFSRCLLHMALHNASVGITKVEYRTQEAKLVESGRDAACMHALQSKYDYILQIDADATFDPNSLERILTTAFVTAPQFDIVGGYCVLSQYPHLPTLDTGTSTWESHFPNEGLLPVIRTGGHFLLAKTSALRKFGPPWFRTRLTVSPIRAIAEVDGFARQHFDGENPLTKHPEWQALVAEARGGGDKPSHVGEDSAFCDAARAAGLQIAVDTDILTGHVSRRVLTWRDHKDAVEEQRQASRRAIGLLE